MKVQRPSTPSVQPQATSAGSTSGASRSANTARSPAASTPPPARGGDRFVQSSSGTPVRAASASAARASRGGGLPAEVPTGTLDYYRQRHDDFVRRNPGVTPPSYYLEYGDKYLQRFNSLGPKELSPEGLEWRDRTLKALQEAIEARRMEDPVGFAQLERDPEAFKKFAYDTHAKAYVDSGLLKLPAQDLLKIATTPDLKDLLTRDGVRQIFDVMGQMKPRDLVDIGGSSVKELIRDIKDIIPPWRSLIPRPQLHLPW